MLAADSLEADLLTILESLVLGIPRLGLRDITFYLVPPFIEFTIGASEEGERSNRMQGGAPTLILSVRLALEEAFNNRASIMNSSFIQVITIQYFREYFLLFKFLSVQFDSAKLIFKSGL